MDECNSTGDLLHDNPNIIWPLGPGRQNEFGTLRTRLVTLNGFVGIQDVVFQIHVAQLHINVIWVFRVVEELSVLQDTDQILVCFAAKFLNCPDFVFNILSRYRSRN